jgi:hypothetical protein
MKASRTHSAKKTAATVVAGLVLANSKKSRKAVKRSKFLCFPSRL